MQNNFTFNNLLIACYVCGIVEEYIWSKGFDNNPCFCTETCFNKFEHNQKHIKDYEEILPAKKTKKND